MSQNIENMLKDMGFYHLQENLEINMVQKKTGIDAEKAASKGVVRKTADTTGRGKTKEEKDGANERQVI